ncbi:P-loop containing nucleoside triphosphate hydrolase protein [Sistotremastrum suecicum HHB10207 ss-3]|uniref:p-loop containing nucleoside triphosphate hydrolase protein n=1 Tax=Sistotremastrum suecicum HHB10207 ss-3 TaxID=1314776 RepID=A0A166IDG4_9AGAM|nr:P-loop containing nucleoside triphosphate hydrolase protein [Sistotremastrum suecicum HHB10207 ss-3]
MASTDNLNDISDESYLQELIFGVDGTEDTKLRNLLASLLTSNRGEYVIRIGLQPSRLALFSDEPPEYPKDWSGVERSVDEIKSGQATVFRTADEIGAKASILFQSLQPSPGMIILLRLPPESISSVAEVRCAVIGNVDSGKSTTLGVLTRGGLDDGRGRARVSLFRHKHEIESGRTSSVGMEILGFSPEGMPVQPGTSHSSDIEVIRREKLSWDQISARSSKVVSFIDLAGHEKYLKTTLYGLTSSAPSLVVLMVGANAGLIGMSKEHLAIALALSVPIVVCITKIDMTPPNILAETVQQVTKILKSPGCRKQPVFVKSMEQAVELPEVFAQEKLCPVFQVSNVTGEGLDYIRMFLNLLPPSDGDQDKFSKDNPLEYSITEVWSVPYVGTVVNGILNAGIIKAGDPVLLGPDTIGGWTSTVVKSIQRKRAPVNSAEAGQCVSLALKRVRRSAVRKGMVIIAKTETPPKAIRHFEGQVLILYHNTTLQKNYQAMLHCGAVRQTVRITGMDNPQGILRTGDRAKVEFEFITNPEYIKVGQKLLFREGKTKGLGVVSRLL